MSLVKTILRKSNDKGQKTDAYKLLVYECTCGYLIKSLKKDGLEWCHICNSFKDKDKLLLIDSKK